MTPLYLKDKLPPNSRALFGGNMRFSFRTILCKSARYKSSFFPNAIIAWNTIIDNFETMPSFNDFKNHIYTLFRPKMKSVYKTHDPLGLKYLFQLRVSLSALRCHKWNHNFNDTPSSTCRCNQGVEDTIHYLFICPIFAIQRISLLDTVTRILQTNNIGHVEHCVSLYLYGHNLLSEFENKNILLATIRYIKVVDHHKKKFPQKR